MNRSSGVLMAMSSLPSNYGIGTMGKCAYKFVDFLKAAGQKYWQFLPLGTTSYGDSPYQTLSLLAKDKSLSSCSSVNACRGVLSSSMTSFSLKSKGFFLTRSSAMAMRNDAFNERL